MGKYATRYSCVDDDTRRLLRQSQIVQSVMYSSDAVLMTQFLYNPCYSLLVCIDLASQLGILMRHNLCSVYV